MLKPEASAGKIISEGHHSLFRVSSALPPPQQKEADEMDAYIDYATKGIDKDKFVKGMFSYDSLWHKGNASPANPEYIVTREYMADANNYDWTDIPILYLNRSLNMTGIVLTNPCRI
ncbi:hypothetical protein LA344_17120 [Bacteroides fragilis]|nr:hypothetical protein [Bacteroides fragilis]MCA5595931.1 hypothetical protein [Bacteroides fragilis]